MAERRMFAKSIIDSDIFVTMPISTQALYFHLAMRADDDGFVSNPRSIAKVIGVNDDDIKILAAKKYILLFDSGVVVIKHWNINNYIQKDRYKPTTYYEEKEMLTEDNKNAYKFKDSAQCIQNVSKMDTQVRLGKYSIDKDSIDNNMCSLKGTNKTFTPPTLEEVSQYCEERHNGIDAQHFIDFYQAKGWMIGKNKMKDWKASVRTWERTASEKVKAKETAQQRDDRNLKRLEEVGEEMLKEWENDITGDYQINQTNQNALTDNINS